MEPPSSPRVRISNLSSLARLPRTRLVHVVQTALPRHGFVELVFADNDHVRTLNREFRDVDEPTDVLSFPAPEFPLLPLGERPLGEIVISVEFARVQAETRCHPLSHELILLAIHGALHLAGFDDEIAKDREVMAARQNEILRTVGLEPIPYETLEVVR